MIRGNNTLHLNEATMIEAMQEWLDARTIPTHRGGAVVDAVKYEGSYGRFVITLKEKEGSK